MAILERGSKVMSAIHKRCYYAMRQEFKMLASVFADYLPPEYPYDVVGGNRFIKQEDFDDTSIFENKSNLPLPTLRTQPVS